MAIKILHCVHRYRPTIGGSEQYMIDISEHLAARGHDVTIFTSKALSSDTWKNALPKKDVINAVKVERFGSMPRSKLVWDIMHYGYSSYPLGMGITAQAAIFLGNGPMSPSWALSQFTRKNDFEVVHTTALPYSHVLYAYWFARRNKIPFVITPFVHIEQKNIFEIKYLFDVIRKADTVISATDYEKRYLESHGVESSRIYTVGLGIDLQELSMHGNTPFKSSIGLKEKEEYILFLGRKEYYKGIDVLIKAFNSIKAEYPWLFLLLAGPKTDHSEKLMQGLDDKDRIIELGVISEREKNDALGSACFSVLPSVHESFGIVFIESWAKGKSVIGARSGAIVDVIDENRTGLLFSPGDSDDLALKLKQLIDSPDLRNGLGSLGRIVVEQRYTKKKITDKVEIIYRSLIEK